MLLPDLQEPKWISKFLYLAIGPHYYDIAYFPAGMNIHYADVGLRHTPAQEQNSVKFNPSVIMMIITDTELSSNIMFVFCTSIRSSIVFSLCLNF